MSSRLGLAKEILGAIDKRRRFWRLSQRGLVLDLRTGEVYGKGEEDESIPGECR